MRAFVLAAVLVLVPNDNANVREIKTITSEKYFLRINHLSYMLAKTPEHHLLGVRKLYLS